MHIAGQYRIPAGVEVRCFDSSSCDLADQNAARSALFTGVAQEINHCCYNLGVDPDGDGIPE